MSTPNLDRLNPNLPYSRTALLVLILALTAAAYFPGLGGSLVFDDYHNIADNKALVAASEDPVALWQALLTGNAGPLKRPLSTLSFAANLAITGQSVWWFKATNLGIHLLNGLLVFVLVNSALGVRRRLVQVPCAQPADSTIALVASAIWMLHPAQLTSVLYVVQRMNSLAATFVLCGLVIYCRARAGTLRDTREKLFFWIGIPALSLMGALTKENAVLLFAYAFVLELCLFGFRADAGQTKRQILCWHMIFVAVPAIAALSWVVANVDFGGSAASSRPFNALERLLTQARVLWYYLYTLFVPRLPDLALYYDDIAISRGILTPVTTLFSVAGIFGVAVTAVLARQRFPWFAFAVLWYLAGHLLESTVILLEIAHIHRNYLPFLGPIVAAVAGAGRLLHERSSFLARLGAVVLIPALAGLTALRADQWADPFSLALYEVKHRPDSSRANYEAGRMYFIANRAAPNPELRASAENYFERAVALDPHTIGPAVALLILNGGENHIPEDPVLEELTRRLSQRPLTQSDVTYLRSLVACQSQVDCARPVDEMLEIFASALNSPRKYVRPKADLLAIMGLYYADVLKDIPGCVRIMEESVKAAPDYPGYRLNLAQALMVAGNLGAATVALDAAEKIDLLGAYAKRIADLREDLAIMQHHANRASTQRATTKAEASSARIP